MPKKQKDYKQWMARKSIINNNDDSRWKISERDVVWMAVGENVGVEIDGKSDKYSRPVVVIAKHSDKCFTGIPLSTKIRHKGTWYFHFEFQNKKEVAVLIQARLFDSSRVYSRIGKLSKKDYEMMVSAYLNLFQKNMP